MRFEEAPKEAIELMLNITAAYFPELHYAHVKLLFDKKKMIRGGRLVLGRIARTNEMLRYLSMFLEEDGYDYLIVIDKVAWECLPKEDMTRIIRHELRHAFMDIEEEKREKAYKLVGHDFEDFSVEVGLNADSPLWAEEAARLISDIHEQRKEEKKEGKKRGRKPKC